MLRVLIACEFSGAIMKQITHPNIVAMSCDLLDSLEDTWEHYKGDVRPILKDYSWDIVIAHPPCTRLCNSGVRWLHERNLWDDLDAAADFFLACYNANAKCVAVENPVMHRYARERIKVDPAFSVQPWEFGDPYTKRTCFWTRNLQPLKPKYTKKQMPVLVGGVHSEPPSEIRNLIRSITYPGIATAIYEQWILPKAIQT